MPFPTARAHHPLPVGETVRFGPSGCAGKTAFDFALEMDGLALRHGVDRLEMRPQSLRVLAILLQHAGHTVTTDLLRRELWGNQQLEWRNSLHQCVRDLRRGLSDDARKPQFVATVARLGYRFVGEVRSPATLEVESKSAECVNSRRRRLSHPAVVFAAGFTTAVLLPASLLLWCVAFAN